MLLGHRVEGLAEVRELARRVRRRARLQLPGGELLGRRLEATDAPRDLRSDQQRRRERCRRRRGRDGEDLHVVVHVEHDQTAEDHRREREPHRQQREPDELQAHRRQQPQRQRERDPRRERAQRHDQRELDHGVNR